MLKLPTLSLHQTAVAMAACLRVDRTPVVIGSPGIGKTTLGRALAPAIGEILGYAADDYPVYDCILSNREAVDVGGWPVTLDDGTVEQKLTGTLRMAAERAGLLLLDEFFTCQQSVQGPAARIVLEGFAGETPIHKDTRVACLANDPEHAPSGIQPTAMLTNRLVVLRCQPLVTEVADYFCGRPEAVLTLTQPMPDDVTWQAERARIMNLMGTLMAARPELVCFEPPPAAVNSGEPFGSPRAWEICADVLAALPDGHVRAMSDVAKAIILGTLGPVSGLTFLSILRAGEHLPTVAEVLADPIRARRPDATLLIPDPDQPGKSKPIGRDINFAAIPLLIEVARVDTYAALVYLDDLAKEIQAATLRALGTNLKGPANTPWRKRGNEIFLALSREFAENATDTAKRKAS